jgi:peptidoglycan lytic transglycosylase
VPRLCVVQWAAMAAALMACTEPPRDAVTPHATAGRDALTGSVLPPDWAGVLEVAEALDSLPPVTPRGRRGPIDHSGRKQVGHASFYSMGFEGRKMAGGRRFDPNADNAASKTLPFGTTARVTNLENGRSAIVTVEDRGPAHGGRVLDVSPKVAKQLDITARGVAPVVVAPIAVPQPDGGVKPGAGAARATSEELRRAVEAAATIAR